MRLEFLKKNLKTSFLLHPFLISLFFLIHEYNVGLRSQIFYIIFFAAIILTLSVLLFKVSLIWNNSRYLSSYLLTYILVFSFFFNYFFENTGIVSRPLFSTIYLILFFLFLFYSKYTSRRFIKVNYFLNLLFLVFITIEAFKFFSASTQDQSNICLPKIDSGNQNNVYIFVLDGYAKNKNLNKYWNFDNSAFMDSLSKFGFYNIEDSYTDYNYTVETVSSMLSLKKIEPIAQKKANLINLLQILNDSSHFVRNFKNQGYTFYNYFLSKVDHQIPLNCPLPLDGIFRNSIIPVVLPGGVAGYLNYLNDISRLEEIKKISKTSSITKKPMLIFLQNMTLHAPYFIDENQSNDYGLQSPKTIRNIRQLLDNEMFEMSPVEKATFCKWRQSYINHVVRLNKIILPVVSIIKENDPDAIILILSDHGSRLLCDLEFSEARKEGFENISFVYFPDKDYALFTKKMSPTQILKIILERSIQINN